MEGKDRKNELAQMLVYAKYYRQITKSCLSTLRLSRKMSYICNIDTDVVNVFFMQFLKYADENSIQEDEVYKVIDLIENYMARRIVCNMPGNALTQVFCALHKDVLKSIDEYKTAGVSLPSNYSDILAYHILRRDGNYILPRDTQFVEAIKTRDAYHMLKPFQIFLFERLENAIPGEYNDVASDMKNKAATLEHIMPQTLNADWMAMLGSNYEETKEKYLHTFANLTLTGINSELSNNLFDIKRDGKVIDGTTIPGYKDSKYRLTRSVTICHKWTSIEMEQRGKEIADTFLKLYPLPHTPFTPLPKPVDEISLEDETFSPTNRLLKGFRFLGQEYSETIWKSMMLKVISIVSEHYPDIMDSLFDTGSYFWSSKKADLHYCSMIAPDKFVWTSLDNKGKLNCLRYLFDKCDIAESELVLLLDTIKD